MKKIAFIIRIFQKKNFHGGGEKLFYNLIKKFSKDGFFIHVYCSKTDINHTNSDETGFINKVTVIDEHYDHNIPETMEKFYEKVKILTNEENYDFIISENITPPVDIAFFQGHSLVNRFKKNKNFLEKLLYSFRKTKKQRIKYQEKWIKQGYSKIFTVSEILKQDIINNFCVPDEKISVVYPGVDITAEKKAIFNKDMPVFGLLAPGFNIKGGYIFLNALRIIKKKGYDFKARIVYPKFSKNLYLQLFLKVFNLSDCIEFLPYQEDIMAFYSSIDCLVVPSLEDTFNMAALEAMSCSKPCIISKNAGANEIIENGKNGFIFGSDKKSAIALAEKMMFLIDNPHKYSELSEAAFKTAKQYSWERTYEKFKEELIKLKSF